jgi:hypothetical protein
MTKENLQNLIANCDTAINCIKEIEKTGRTSRALVSCKSDLTSYRLEYQNILNTIDKPVVTPVVTPEPVEPVITKVEPVTPVITKV